MTSSSLGFSLQADQHIYLLPHVSKNVFQIRTCSTVTARSQMLSTELYDLDGGTALLFKSNPGPGSQRAAAVLRKLATPHQVVDVALEGKWYDMLCRRELIDTATEQFEWSAIVPFRVVCPKDPNARAAQEAQEIDYRNAREAVEREEAAARHRQAMAEKEAADKYFRQRDAAIRQAEAKAAFDAMHQRLLANDFFAPGHRPAKLLEELTAKLKKFNVLCNGYCELKRIHPLKLELNFYVLDDFAQKVSRLAWELRKVLVLDVDENHVVTRFSYPFKRETSAFPPAKSKTVSHQSISIEIEEEFFLDVLLSLQPGIRGWDLPADSAVLGYRPRGDANLGRSTPPAACPVRKAWAAARSCDTPTTAQYLSAFGVTLGWEPPNLRFCAVSPFSQDDGAPVLLLRLVRDHEAVGVQKIRLDTSAREVLAFKGCAVENAVGVLWSPKPHVYITTCLEDAMAMQNQLRKPCIVAPTPAALAALEWAAGLEKVTALLPTASPESWVAAIEALKIRDDVPKIGTPINHLFPHELSDCPGFIFPAEWAWQRVQSQMKAPGKRRK